VHQDIYKTRGTANWSLKAVTDNKKRSSGIRKIMIKRFLLLFTGILMLAFGINSSAEEKAASINTQTMKLDFMGAAHLPKAGGVIVAGHDGLVAKLTVEENKGQLQRLQNTPDEDFTAIGKLSDSEAFIGGSTGNLYKFSGEEIKFLAKVSEYDEPVLDIVHEEGTTWVVGARGMVAKSDDSENFEIIEITEVMMLPANFPGGESADWYLGVQNLDRDNLNFSAFVKGKPAVEDEDYIIYPDEGFIQVQNELDMKPTPPRVSGMFSPGPAFRGGDVSWNKVLLEDGVVTLAGEFGLIIQSDDGGESWTRRNTKITPREPEPAYWMSGVQKGSTLWLAGAAGVNAVSSDGGKTWSDNTRPGREGIFGVALTEDNKPVITGAVGLIGTMENNNWILADRTKLKLLSWLKNPVALPDGSLLVLGGRATAIKVKGGKFERITIELSSPSS